MIEIETCLRDNLDRIRKQIDTACRNCGRDPDEVRLVAVTKYVDDSVMRTLARVGCQIVGENRADAMREKHQALSDLDLQWHFIGHLQRNKVKWVVPDADLIHSVDSLRLVEAIDLAAKESAKQQKILLEINISGESQKQGLTMEGAQEILQRAQEFPNVQICGVMGMSGLEVSPDVARKQFAQLKHYQKALMPFSSAKDPLSEISMGMSGDFLIAISEGATLVRVGSLLFEGVI